MRHLPLLSLLAACASPPADLLDEADAPSLLAAFEAPPPSPPSFRLRAENFVAGDTATLVVQGAPPNTTIHFAHSRTGIGEGGCPPSLNGACGALLRRIKVSPRTAQTDGRGNASLTFTVPAARDGQYVVIQAALADTPWQMSNPVARPIGPPGTPRLPGADLDGDGFTINDGDRADHDAAFHPLAADIVGDTRDWNCDDIDGMDFDRDGHTSATIGGDDCDDNVRPGGVEVCDGLDNDCDLAIDEDAADAWLMYVDADLDGAGDPGASALACAEAPGFSFAPNDCDDTDSTRYPGAPEQCDVEDDDCDGFVDEDAIDGFGAWLDVDLDGQARQQRVRRRLQRRRLRRPRRRLTHRGRGRDHRRPPDGLPRRFAGLDTAIAQVWNQDRDSMDNVVETNDELGQSLP